MHEERRTPAVASSSVRRLTTCPLSSAMAAPDSASCALLSASSSPAWTARSWVTVPFVSSRSSRSSAWWRSPASCSAASFAAWTLGSSDACAAASAVECESWIVCGDSEVSGHV